MSTKSIIALKTNEGTYKTVYCQMGGTDNLETLNENYLTINDINDLLNLGDMSYLGKYITVPQNAIAHNTQWMCNNNYNYDYTFFYGRDRGEINQQAKIFNNLSDLKQYCKENYCMLFIFENGKWN